MKPVPHCGHRQAGDYPVGLEPRRVFGPNLEALVSTFTTFNMPPTSAW